MLYTITEITDKEIILKNNKRVHTLQKEAIDPFAKLEVGTQIEINGDEYVNNEIPYSISLRRRMDIREHHAEEARNGDI